MSELKKGLFHDWVPKPVGLLVLFVLTLTVLTSNGLYTANMTDMVGGLGTMTEYLTMANYAATIGMAAVFPFLMQLKGAFTTRQLLLATLSGLAFLTVFCALTTSPELLILASFLMGCFKMLAMIEVIIPIMMLVSPNGDRPRFYAIFYPFSILMGQLSGYLSTELAYDFGWQYMYWFMLPLLLISLLCAVVFFHNGRATEARPVGQLDWVSFFQWSGALMLLNYGLVFARVEDYFDSVAIQGAFIGFAILLLLFIRRQLNLEKPYLNLQMLKIRNVWSSLILICFLGLFLAAGAVQTVLTTSVLKYSPQTNSELSLWMVPGIIVGGIFCFLWYRKKLPLKYNILLGFAAFLVAQSLLLFRIHPGIGMQDLYLINALRGFGMVTLFATIGVYMADKLDPLTMFASSAFLMIFRSFIGVAFSSALVSYGLYHGQLENVFQLAQNMDALNPNVAARLQSSGTMGLYGTAQIQAMLLSAQELSGYIIEAGLIMMLLVVLFRFRPLNRRKLVKWRRRLNGLEFLFRPWSYKTSQALK
ncbi:MFS transporter [Adhaeribacter soli]|uniref:MFS transporter n=1 Tax=Adhaeribacter soli TaxID=2607655 RepID=A0A5N1IRM0_9BACT|nr:MFS transporter [Adhaeribacter soli]KAA9332815.1 MFS transporter [Adhaeribacter soli]